MRAFCILETICSSSPGACSLTPAWLSTADSSVCLQMSSQPEAQLFRIDSQQLASRDKGSHDYDSGNDTSSPPSSKASASQQDAANIKSGHFQLVPSAEKLRSTDKDDVSDSGNSVTSYASLCESSGEDGSSGGAGRRCRREAAGSSQSVWTFLNFE